MKQRSLANQHRMLEVLLERFAAVDVTGLDAWEKARAVHGRSAAGLAEGATGVLASGVDRGASVAVSRRPYSAAKAPHTPAPSASPVAIPLFDIESEAA